MTAVRVQDKLFLALTLPAAAVAAYVVMWRTDTVRRVETREREVSSLVASEDFQMEKSRRDRRLRDAEEELSRVRSLSAQSIRKVHGTSGESAAARERAVLSAFGAAGLRVVSAADATGDAHGGAVLQATGTRPTPCYRRYVLEGRYPMIIDALKSFDAAQAPIVVDSIGMADGKKWEVTLWL